MSFIRYFSGFSNLYFLNVWTVNASAYLFEVSFLVSTRNNQFYNIYEYLNISQLHLPFWPWYKFESHLFLQSFYHLGEDSAYSYLVISKNTGLDPANSALWLGFYTDIYSWKQVRFLWYYEKVITVFAPTKIVSVLCIFFSAFHKDNGNKFVNLYKFIFLITVINASKRRFTHFV